ncbi:HDOD domain-containing protein [Campylobacter avium]|nr:HDOD domain-containing protein [Campylobacter avium]
MDINELLVESVDKLPALPQTVQELQSYVAKAGSDVRVDTVAQIISADPLVTARLLQLANSPFYSFKSNITTLQQVVSLLGITNVKNIIMADSIEQNFKVDVSPYGLDTDEFLKKRNEESTFISSWLSQEDKNLSYMLVPCAMLLRLGMMVFSNFLIQNKKDKEFLAALKKSNFENCSAVEEDFLGVDHLSFLGFLFHKWNFDEDLIETVCFINNPNSAEGKVLKSAYALAIVNRIFAPHNGGSAFMVSSALSLIKEAKQKGVNFDMDNFISKLPAFAKVNLPK